MIQYISSTGTKDFFYKPDFLENTSCFVKPITTAQDKRAGTTNYIKIKSATSKGYEEATEGDSINFSIPNSETRRGRVGKGVAQTLDTGCQQGVIIDRTNDFREDLRIYETYAPSLRSERSGLETISNYKIRRLTPRECFRLMDFPDTFTWNVSDSQAYKQAGNSIVVGVLAKIIKNLKL